MACGHCVSRVINSVSSVVLRGDSIDLVLLGILLVVGAVLLLAYAMRIRAKINHEKRSHGIPQGTILYSDLNIPASPLFSKRLGLVGKPDYIVQKQERYIPVEVKSGRGSHPQQSHILQLAAYCQLVEDVSGVFVSEGILVYNDIPYTILFDPKLRFELESVMRTMRASLKKGATERNHHESGRCRWCSMRKYCTDFLG